VPPAVCVLALAAPAAAQSQRDLRIENEQLQAQVADLQVRLQARIAEIEELHQRIARLEQQLAAAGRGSMRPRPPEQVTIDESDPRSSPRALLRALGESYVAALGEMEMGDDEDGRERRAYMRMLERWVARVNREMTAPVQWHVRLLEVSGSPRRLAVRMTAVDPVTDVELGDPFEALVPRALARRVDSLLADDGDAVLLLRGVLRPAVAVNPRRRTSGPFDSPRLVGPFAEFHFAVEASSLTRPPAETPPAESPAAPAPGAAPPADAQK
jgi:hypothetical protein